MQKEFWKDVPNYDGAYQVSNLGRVKSLKYGKEKLLKVCKNHYYYCVVLFKNGKRKTKNIHQLLAETFLNHTPNGFKLVVDHINNNPLDNRLENIQIITHRENSSKDKKGGSSKYIGVTERKLKNKSKWVAQISLNGTTKRIGVYETEYDAHLAYQKELNKL